MIGDLVAFLRARLNEDEQVARSVEDRSAPWDGQWVADGPNGLRTYNGWVLAFSTATTDGRALPLPLAPGITEHWARHDPARVLAEVDAKRRIVDRIWKYAGPHMFTAGPDVLRLLALPYRDHPDYHPEWASEG